MTLSPHRGDWQTYRETLRARRMCFLFSGSLKTRDLTYGLIYLWQHKMQRQELTDEAIENIGSAIETAKKFVNPEDINIRQ